MDRRMGFRIVIGLLMLAVVVGIGMYTYNLGFVRGLAQTGAVAARPWGPWGYGFFPFFPFFPLFPLIFFVLFWVVLCRALFWRGRRYGGCCGEAHFDSGRRTTHL